MKLDITLKDSKYCDGCPCKMMALEKYAWGCLHYMVTLETKDGFPPAGNPAVRYKKCIDENGE